MNRRNFRNKVQVYRSTLFLIKDPKQDPDPQPKHPWKSDPDQDFKKIIPDPQHCH